MKVSAEHDTNVDDSPQQIDQLIERYMEALRYLANK